MSEVKKVITVTDRSTKALNTAATGLVKITQDLSAIAEQAVSLATDIEYKQNDLDNLNQQFDTKFREASAELKLKVIEDEDKVLGTLLKSRSLVTIDPKELATLRSDLAVAQDTNEDALAEAKSAGERSAAIAFNAQKSAIESNHRVAIAQFEANEKSFEQRIAFLEEQNKDLKGQITAERETRLEIARADAQRQGVTVNNGK